MLQENHVNLFTKDTQSLPSTELRYTWYLTLFAGFQIFFQKIENIMSCTYKGVGNGGLHYNMSWQGYELEK